MDLVFYLPDCHKLFDTIYLVNPSNNVRFTYIYRIKFFQKAEDAVKWHLILYKEKNPLNSFIVAMMPSASVWSGDIAIRLQRSDWYWL